MMRAITRDTEAREVKEIVAEAWLRFPLRNPFQIAIEVCPNDPLFAKQIAENFTRDPEVMEIRQDLLDKYGEEYFLPSKTDLAHAVYEDAIGARAPEDRMRGYRLYADIMGYIKKDEGSTQPVTINNVIAYRTPEAIAEGGTIEDFKKKVIEHQRALTHEA